MKQIQILILNSLKHFGCNYNSLMVIIFGIRLKNELIMNEIEMGNVEMNKHPIIFRLPWPPCTNLN